MFGPKVGSYDDHGVEIMAQSTTSRVKERLAATDPSPEPRKTVVKIGNLGAEFTLEFGKSGNPFARSRLAVQKPGAEGWKDAETVWYYVTVFGSVAEHAAESLSKGDRVIVVGSPELRKWTTSEGEEREQPCILANAIGPDLRFSTCKVSRERRQPTQEELDSIGDEVIDF